MKKKGHEEEQDTKAGKASLIQGVYKIVEHQLINNNTEGFDMAKMTQYYSDKQNVTAMDQLFK
jgi:hypothetical protein